MLVTDPVATADPAWPRLPMISVAPLLAAAIRRIHVEGSLGDLFLDGPFPVQAAHAAH